MTAVETLTRRLALREGERRSLVGMATFVLLLHLLGWGVLVALVVPAGYQAGGQLFGIGLGVTAYTLGLRHAFDADHIAAIDNTTRKLMSDGQRPMSVGFWFSLGHSSIVFVMVALLAFGIRTLAGAKTVEDLKATSIALPGGRKVRLDELGKVDDTAEEPRQFARFNGEPVVAFAISRLPGNATP